MPIITQATVEHVALIAPLFDAYRVFYKQLSDLEGARSYLSERLANGEATVFFASDDNGEALGFVLLYPTFSSVSLGNVWILNDLFVKPHARKQGVGELLMARGRQLAAETDARYLVLRTATDNHPAQSLYERLGYQRDTNFYTYQLLV